MNNMVWTRKCEECGYRLVYNPPPNPITDVWLNKKCRKCHSLGLDYGSWTDRNVWKPGDKQEGKT